MPRTTTLLAVFVALPSFAFGQIWQREVVDFPMIQQRAKDLASKPYAEPKSDSLPEWMTALTYDQYRDIRFNPDQALWTADDSPFRAMFFHPGYLFREPVALNEFTGTHNQRIRLAELGLRPGQPVTLLQRGVGGARVVSVADSRIALDSRTAGRIPVTG